jgi:hypothetical protein
MDHRRLDLRLAVALGKGADHQPKTEDRGREITKQKVD